MKICDHSEVMGDMFILETKTNAWQAASMITQKPTLTKF